MVMIMMMIIGVSDVLFNGIWLIFYSNRSCRERQHSSVPEVRLGLALPSDESERVQYNNAMHMDE
jgi:hypothetical protein